MNSIILRTKRGTLVVNFRKISLLEGLGSEWLRKARCWNKHKTIKPTVNTINNSE